MTATNQTIAEAGRALRAGSVTSAQLTMQALDRIRALDPRLNAFITITEERALADAARADAELAASHDRGPLHGIPYGLKDIFDTAGIRTTCHSKLLLDNVPAADSTVAAKLAASGGVLMGKLATHEFAIGGPSFDLPFPPARNPWNTDHQPGGSSSGSGVAISAGMLRLAMGSDTGGSIRGPSSWCGVVGIKPTYGRVSRHGVFPLSPSLDHCGPLAACVEDAAIALQIVAGYDPADPGSADLPVPDYRASLRAGVGGLRIGVPRHFFAAAPGSSPETIAAIDAALTALRDAGAVVEDITLPDYDLFFACGRVIMPIEAFAIHENSFRTRPLDFSENSFLRIVVGAACTGPDLVQAHRVRRSLTDAVSAALSRYDALVTASALAPAPPFKAPPAFTATGWPIQSIPFNVTGHPAMSVPLGLGAAGLPLSLQVVGRHFDEAMVFRVGQAIEDVFGCLQAPFPG